MAIVRNAKKSYILVLIQKNIINQCPWWKFLLPSRRDSSPMGSRGCGSQLRPSSRRCPQGTLETLIACPEPKYVFIYMYLYLCIGINMYVLQLKPKGGHFWPRTAPELERTLLIFFPVTLIFCLPL